MVGHIWNGTSFSRLFFDVSRRKIKGLIIKITFFFLNLTPNSFLTHVRFQHGSEKLVVKSKIFLRITHFLLGA